MNSYINQQNVLNAMLGYAAGWGAQFPGPGAGSSGGSMGDALPSPRSPRHQHKRRRLSLLLDKLSIQMRNNNNYPTPHWLMLDTPPIPFTQVSPYTEDEAPLDLSLKSKHRATTPEPAFPCNACGQTFSGHDRLTKHLASRHRSKPEAVRAYECEVCLRRFTRSDMLTRHARLHSGLKPYACASCGQVFSRSDHLATHQRTHTGEKPYRCPKCPYAACRRDMITRHMRTHMRHTQLA